MNALYQRIKEQVKKNESLYFLIYHIKVYGLYLINRISRYRLEKRRFYRKLGYPLNLKKPRSYNEKIVWKKIYDRNPLLPSTADKYQVRSYIKKVLGEEQAKEILIPLLYVTNKPKTIPFEEFPLSFIIKPSHASGLNIIVKDENINKKEIIKICQRWLQIPYGLNKLEWAYQPIKRKIIIQELLEDENGKLPEIEYKFYMFRGKCELIRVDSDLDSFLHHLKKVFFTPDWKMLNVTHNNRQKAAYIHSPVNLSKMIKIAEKLSKPFDHVRVDLYNINGKIYFGELTHYEASGLGQFNPQSFDFELGKHWKIEPEYWKK